MSSNYLKNQHGLLGDSNYFKRLSDINKFTEKTQGIAEMVAKINPVDNIDLEWNEKIEKYSECIRQEKAEHYEREVENNENLKALVDYNNEISNYNRELVKLNEKILNKVNSLDDTLFFLFQTFKDKYDSDKELGQEHNALLLELITTIDSKDENKIKDFFNKVPVPLGVGLLVEYFKMKLGLS
ncbi:MULTISPECIES: hypothetical protein [unclassified Clostridium]|uniref:hypothetical protein n=1 Tax=unclassified Clostridium TaxID=2614128 RepID=UPI00207AEFBD|nr:MULTISPECIES: hypothetical protein [unclassified Clostridium]